MLNINFIYALLLSFCLAPLRQEGWYATTHKKRKVLLLLEEQSKKGISGRFVTDASQNTIISFDTQQLPKLLYEDARQSYTLQSIDKGTLTLLYHSQGISEDIVLTRHYTAKENLENVIATEKKYDSSLLGTWQNTLKIENLPPAKHIYRKGGVLEVVVRTGDIYADRLIEKQPPYTIKWEIRDSILYHLHTDSRLAGAVKYGFPDFDPVREIGRYEVRNDTLFTYQGGKIFSMTRRK